MDEQPRKITDLNEELKNIDLRYYPLIEHLTMGMLKISGTIADLVKKEKDTVKLKVAHNQMRNQLTFLRNSQRERSVLMRESTDNLTGLFSLLDADKTDSELRKYIKMELKALDTLIANMTAETAAQQPD